MTTAFTTTLDRAALERDAVRTVDALEALVGTPKATSIDKVSPVLTPLMRAFIGHAPFYLLATANEDGTCDVSPKGDPPGFTLVLDRKTIAIPDRPGNRRVDGFTNILENPHAGLIYLVPGRTETLRINGRARVLRDAPFFDRMIVKGNRPRLALLVEIEQVFFHCGKAALRSALWDPGTWHPDALPPYPRIVKDVQHTEETLEELERYYGAEYLDRLYTY